MRKVFSFFLLAALLVLAFGAVRPALASNPTDPIYVKFIEVKSTYNRTWNWDIAKTGSTAALTLSTGQTASVGYTVTVTGTPADGGWQVNGSFAFRNTTASEITVDSVTVDLGDGIIFPAICTDPGKYPPVIQPGYTVNCSFSGSLPNGNPRTATVTIVSTAGTFSDTAAVTFGTPASETGKCINVDDSLVGFLGQVCGSTNPTSQTFNYSYTVGPFNSCGLYEVNNTATIRETGKSTSWKVIVDVPCAGGCTLTQGYWKTHSQMGPAPYDPAWMNIGPLQEQTTFFRSGQTWYQVFWTAPAGNAYYNLAHQYMAAKLNVLDGASAPAEVTSAIASAEALFNSVAPSGVTRTNRAQFLSLASTLDSYNNGLIGPGHCSE